MVKDPFNRYFNDLVTELREQYPPLQAGTVYTNDPLSFPYMYMYQIDGTTALQTLSRTEDGISFGVRIETYSDKSANEAREIANAVRSLMTGWGFKCSYFSPMENLGDTSIRRFIGQYEKIEV